MRIHRSGPFRRDFAQLPKLIKRRAEKALRLLIQNLRHPSLEARIVDKKRRIWKAKVNGGYRLTFQLERDTITLRRIGSHGPMERPERWSLQTLMPLSLRPPDADAARGF